ncbi:MAG: GntP family permease [Planctomycetaceae bacterium]
MDSATTTVLIILAGVAVVVGGVLWFRLHAFLALILAALVVAGLTPQSTYESYEVESAALAKIQDPLRDVVGGEVVIDTKNGKPKVATNPVPGENVSPPTSVATGVPVVPKEGLQLGARLLLVRRSQESGRYEPIATFAVTRLVPSKDGQRELAHLRAVGDFDFGQVQTGDCLIDAVTFKNARKKRTATIGSRVSAGFGSTCASIGILIALASVIGKCLLDSGAADRIVRTMLRWFGEAGAPAAFVISGFLLGIPVFFDTVFYLMIPLGKAMQLRTERNYLFYVLAIVCGGTMAHSLVPPTPGPLFVAEALGVNMGTMILAGGFVGMVTATFGYFYARWANRHNVLPLRETPDFTLAEIEAAARVDESELPPFWFSLLPVLLPVVLIAGLTIMKRMSLWGTMSAEVKMVFETLGDKNIALLIATLCALATLIVYRRQSLASLGDSIQKALAGGGVIILITAAGGAFGEVLRQTGVASQMGELKESSPLFLCTAAFFITTAIRTAQGSATVAMITSVGILGGLVADGQLTFHPVYLALAIGCGSKPVAWMNDSGFWVITRMSGMTEREGLKYVTPMTASMGLVGLLTVLAGVTLFPTL